MEKSLFLPEGTTVTGFVVLGDFWPLLWIWLIAVNAAAFLVFGLDKWKAKRKAKNEAVRRVPEKRCFCWPFWAAAWGPSWGCGSFTTRPSTGGSGTACQPFWCSSWRLLPGSPGGYWPIEKQGGAWDDRSQAPLLLLLMSYAGNTRRSSAAACSKACRVGMV